VSEQLAGDTDYENLINELEENGAYIPESISNAVQSAEDEYLQNVQVSMNRMYAETGTALDRIFANGFDVSTKVRVNFTVQDSQTSSSKPSSVQDYFSNYAVKHAEGGIFDTPHYGLFAEDGPEAFIPLDGSSNAVSIWQQAGQMLGLGTSRDAKLYEGISRDSGQGNTFQINYTPSITIKGNASEEDVQNAVALGADDVVKIIKSYMGAQNRVSYKSRKR
jgi:hypothetical protein